MVEMSLSLNSWNSKKALEMVREMMVNDSKGYLSDAVKLLGEGAYASVYKLKRKKDNKDVAVRISVTNDVNVCNRERRPRKLFDQLKVLKTPLTSSESDKRFRYDKFLSVPELKYDITFCRDGQKENISGYGLVFESELETGDADVDLSKPETIPKSEQFYKYLKKLSKSILKALSILHKHNKVHNDVKPNNILKREKGDGHFSFKLSDYGSMCTIKDFEEITKEDKKNFLESIEGMDGSEQKNKLTDWKVQKVSSLDPKHFKRTLQNREYIAPEKMEAFLAFNEIDSEACDAGCGIDKFVASYNEIIKKLNKVKGKSDVFSLGRTISDIADKLKKSSSASRDQNEEIKLKRFIDKLTEKELAKRPTAEEALKDSYLAN